MTRPLGQLADKVADPHQARDVDDTAIDQARRAFAYQGGTAAQSMDMAAAGYAMHAASMSSASIAPNGQAMGAMSPRGAGVAGYDPMMASPHSLPPMGSFRAQLAAKVEAAAQAAQAAHGMPTEHLQMAAVRNMANLRDGGRGLDDSLWMSMQQLQPPTVQQQPYAAPASGPSGPWDAMACGGMSATWPHPGASGGHPSAAGMANSYGHSQGHGMVGAMMGPQ